MTIGEYVDFLGIKRVRLAEAIGMDNAYLCRFLRHQMKLPERYVFILSQVLAVTEEEIRADKIHDERAKDQPIFRKYV